MSRVAGAQGREVCEASERLASTAGELVEGEGEAPLQLTLRNAGEIEARRSRYQATGAVTVSSAGRKEEVWVVYMIDRPRCECL